MPSDLEFRKLLLNIADDMSNEDRKIFVFLLGDDIPKRKREEPLVDIFEILINVGRISETDCSYLVEILEGAKLFTVALKVARFDSRNSLPVLPPTLAEDSQPIEIILMPNTLTTENSQQVPTLHEFISDINEPDAMVIIDYSPVNSLDTISVDIEPEPAVMPLFLENIDLKTFANDLWSDEFLQKININIPPYGYQRELVQSAIQAGNTIVCLRTGGGKTFVAALLIKYYLIKKMTLPNAKKFLAFFIVPRRAMLKQQSEKLKQFGNLRVAPCEEYNDAIQYINTYDVIICTPQKLLNCLKAKTIFLSNIDLLCFDECHDPVVRNQYIGIMQYLMCKTIEYIPPVDSPPIIIGLTAAIGFHQSTSGSIPRSLIDLCAIFNCLTITTIMNKENEEELERIVHHISEDEILCVDKQKLFDTLRLSIEKELKDLISQLFLNKNTNPSQIFPEKDFDINGYEQNLELLKQTEQKNQNFSFVILIEYILPIYRHIKSLIDLTPELVLSDLKDYFELTYKRREHPIDIDTFIYDKCQNLLKKKLIEFEESQQTLSNPKLDKLVELLKKHAEKPNSPALILVERTFYAKKICEFLQNHSELKNIIKPCWLVGQNSTGSKQANKKEDSILKDFKAGIYNVLISTDIVQAGLDMPECSLVLRYDFVPDSIGTVQARVRARAIDCKYYLITTKDSSNYKKELDNREREQVFKETLDAWKQTSSDQFKERVISEQITYIKEWNNNLIKALIAEKNFSKNTELNGDVLCRACGYTLGQLAELRQYGPSYFVNDRYFYNRIEEKLFPEPEEFGKTLVTGKALCGSKICRAELGRIQKLKDQPKIGPIYPLKCAAIKIRQIEKENGKEAIILKKKWSLMPFKIPSFESSSTDSNDEIFHDSYENIPDDCS